MTCKLPAKADGEGEEPKSREIVADANIRAWCEWGINLTGMGDFDDCMSQIGGRCRGGTTGRGPGSKTLNDEGRVG